MEKKKETHVSMTLPVACHSSSSCAMISELKPVAKGRTYDVHIVMAQAVMTVLGKSTMIAVMRTEMVHILY